MAVIRLRDIWSKFWELRREKKNPPPGGYPSGDKLVTDLEPPPRPTVAGPTPTPEHPRGEG